MTTCCPNCESANTLPILYGEIDQAKADELAAQFHIGGRDRASEDRYCRDCEKGWCTNDDGSLTVRDLRRRWKPTKVAHSDSPEHESLLIRVHRACSWLQHVEELGPKDSVDARLIYRWIAFNSLYGRWNEEKREPEPEWQSVVSFTSQLLEIDQSGHLAAMLEEHRKLVMSIFDDEHLSRFFWQEPTDERARKATKTKFDARTWYSEKRYGRILDRVLERLYLMRCQLVHGAATFDSDLNRTAVRRSETMLGHVVTAMLLVIIDHGINEDWGSLCYPPLRPVAANWKRP